MEHYAKASEMLGHPPQYWQGHKGKALAIDTQTPLGTIANLIEDDRICGVSIAGILDGRDYSGGAFVSVYSASQALRDAVEEEHPACLCYSDGCDITEANREGFSIWAAHLLQGATETPLLDAVWRALEANGEAPTDADVDASWAGFAEHMRQFATHCPGCNGYTFHDGSGAEWCAHCGADLTEGA